VFLAINKSIAPTMVVALVLLLFELSTDSQAQNEDFLFFTLIVDGKASKDKIISHCEGRPTGFSVVAENLNHKKDMALAQYNVTQVANINAIPSEWTGAVYKPLCLASITLLLTSLHLTKTAQM
jgi:hypothetical protein